MADPIEILTIGIQMFIGLALTFISIYVGMFVLQGIVYIQTKKKLNIKGNLQVGNTAMALLVAAMTLGIAMMGVVGVSNLFDANHVLDNAYFEHVFFSEILVIIGVLLAVGLIALILGVMNKIFKDVEVLGSVRDGNMALALVMSTVIIIVCYVGRIALLSIAGLF